MQVGQIIKCVKDEYFPADLILMTSSEDKGICYIETKSLDGETNLKHKLANIETFEFFGSNPDEKLSNMNVRAKIEDPHVNIYQFSGTIVLNENSIFMITD